jgi:hypothetical protein
MSANGPKRTSVSQNWLTEAIVLSARPNRNLGMILPFGGTPNNHKNEFDPPKGSKTHAQIGS